jgi:hypothetical protein
VFFLSYYDSQHSLQLDFFSIKFCVFGLAVKLASDVLQKSLKLGNADRNSREQLIPAIKRVLADVQRLTACISKSPEFAKHLTRHRSIRLRGILEYF